jgi:hypothetical protein
MYAMNHGRQIYVLSTTLGLMLYIELFCFIIETRLCSVRLGPQIIHSVLHKLIPKTLFERGFLKQQVWQKN